MQSVDDFIFVPTLVSLLRNRRLKGRARAALVGYGEPVVDSLAFFLRDQDEDIWVRRHIPGTLAQIPSQKTMDVLVAALGERDGFIRYKVVSALERLRREHPELTLAGESIEKLASPGSATLLQLPVAARQPVRQGEAARPTRCSRRGSSSRWRGSATGSSSC